MPYAWRQKQNLRASTFSFTVSSKCRCGMSATGSRPTRSEDELGEKWDRCIADSLIKTGKSKNSAGLFLIDAHLPSRWRAPVIKIAMLHYSYMKIMRGDGIWIILP